MALSTNARRTLKQALADIEAGDEVADVIDAGSGTLTTNAKDHLKQALANEAMGTAIAAKIDAGTALTGNMYSKLAIALASGPVATEIAAVLSA